MPYYSTDTKNTTIEQLIAITAIDTLFREQGQKTIITSLDPLTFSVSGSINPGMKLRLFVDRVGIVLNGWKGVMEGSNLVVSKENSEQPAKRGRPRGSKGATNIQPSQVAEVAEPDIS